ncbi:hypothetical protein F5X68DRAFT_231470 [Plectosphaerella plurivora]|uniref:Transmembrane protein n=1 Tax=Plectosphaerella plurivora TaxID=936078 RepID=A0A9P8VEI0_9PEZI|nr:hypothetical protein F5X68DRAFT_231470 [Plectosphaerella plurivora]
MPYSYVDICSSAFHLAAQVANVPVTVAISFYEWFASLEPSTWVCILQVVHVIILLIIKFFDDPDDSDDPYGQDELYDEDDTHHKDDE